MFASFSSTLFLQLFTHPYVTQLEELPPPLPSSSSSSSLNDKGYIATRLNILGNESKSELFHLNDTSRVAASAHPFASFTVKGKYYYIFGGDVKDETVRAALASK
jgi:hypothetical protein